MHRKVTAIVLVLCLVSSTFAALPAASSSKFDQFIQLEKTPFGRSLLTTLEVHLGTNEPVSNLLNQLQAMADQLKQEQSEADVSHKEYQDKCEEDISQLQEEIAVAEQAKQEASDQLNVDEPRLEHLVSEKARLEQEIVDTQQYIQKLHKTRQEEKAEFEQKIEEINEAIVLFTEARKIVERVSDQYAPENQSFLEKSNSLGTAKSGNVFAQVGAKLSKVNLKRKGINALAKVLAQIMTRTDRLANQNIVNRILGLFDELVESLNQAAVDERRNEEVKIQVYQEEVETNTKKLNDLIVELNQTEYEIHATRERIVLNRQKLAEAIRTINEKTSQLGHRQAECRDEAQNYNEQTTKRTEERDIIEQVIDIISTKAGLLKEYSKERA